MPYMLGTIKVNSFLIWEGMTSLECCDKVLEIDLEFSLAWDEKGNDLQH
jgi:hypothetical protein